MTPREKLAAKRQASREKTFKSTANKRTPAKKGSRSRLRRKFWSWSGSETLYLERDYRVYNENTKQYQWRGDVDDRGGCGVVDSNARDKHNNRLYTSYVWDVSCRKTRVRAFWYRKRKEADDAKKAAQAAA